MRLHRVQRRSHLSGPGRAGFPGPGGSGPAALDLVNAAPPLYPSALPEGTEPGRDKFRALHPGTDGTHLLKYAETLGVGTREYRLVTI